MGYQGPQGYRGDRSQELQRKLWREQYRNSNLKEEKKALLREIRVLRAQLNREQEQEEEETEEISVTTMSGEQFIASVPLRKPVYSDEPVERPTWVESVTEPERKGRLTVAGIARVAVYVVVASMHVILVLGQDNPLLFSGMCMVLIFLIGVLIRTPGSAKKPCQHADAVDVNSEVTGELLARWCAECETQLVKKEAQ